MTFKSTFAAAAAAALLALAPAMPAEAQGQTEQARSLNELLRLVEQGQARDTDELRRREREFEQQKSEQERLLREARQRQQAVERASQQLESRFEANEVEIGTLNQQLNDSLGELRELFGVVQLVAGDTASQIETSLTSIQYEGRRQFLLELAERMGQSARIASVEELERLWFEMQREATELGRVVRMPLEVVDANGNRSTRDVVRVGAFNIVSDGKYLSYEPSTRTVSELVRQPDQRRFISSTSNIVNARDGFAAFGVDVTRGQILALLIQQPNLRERIAQGAEIGYLIIALGLLALFNRAGIGLSLWTAGIGHVVINLPLCFSILYASMGEHQRAAEQAARDLGAGEVHVLALITAPMLAPAMLAAYFLAFTFSWDEFIIAYLLTRFDVTLPVEIWSLLRSGLTPRANAIGSLVFLVSVGVLIVMQLTVFRRARP